MATEVNGRKPELGGWTSTQAYVMAIMCLLIGVCAGYFFRGSGSFAPPTADSSSQAPAGVGGQQMGQQEMAQQQVTPEQLKRMADKQVEPMVEKLKTTPNDSALIASVGNIYYDAQQYNDAVTYYDRALKIEPANTSVRTDLGTAYWYLGNADKAIEEFQTALKTDPNKANTLLNLGVVQWQGKMDASGAISTWQKLLDTNPGYENKAKVQDLIAQAKKHMNLKPGSKTDKPTS